MEDLIKKVPSGSIFVFLDGINILSKRIITFNSSLKIRQA